MTIAGPQKHRGNRHHRHVPKQQAPDRLMSGEVSSGSGRVTVIPMICANLAGLRAGEGPSGLFTGLNQVVSYCIN
ncbi:hypothetical protein MNBD_GAMMA11-2875 [hydrothermal vent metagenome]|uniref:Uncharacterized protein n=1 Tax=hydrothermal vent metagenome TaxID=652676 RepID=A0A3B0X8W1_9ZZZZ